MKKILWLSVLIFLYSASLAGEEIRFDDFASQNRNNSSRINHSDKTGYSISKNSEESLEVEFSVAGLTTDDVASSHGVFSQLSMERGFAYGEVGTPSLPAFSELIEIPAGSTPRVKVLSYETEEYKLSDLGIVNPLMPRQPSYLKNIDPEKIIFQYDTDAYEKNEFSRNAIAKVEVMGTMRGAGVATLSVFPFSYNPLQGLIKIYNNIKVVVEFDQTKGATLAESKEKAYSPFFENNFNYLINHEKSVRQNNSEKDFNALPANYLLVANNKLEGNDKLQEFIDWKKQKGFNIVDHYVSSDASVTEIDSWIEDQYEDLNPKPAFLLIVGDVDGTYAVASKTENISGASVSDQVYGVIGNITSYNHVKSIYVGRFSVRSLADLSAQVDKTIWYERDQFFAEGHDLGYLKNVVGTAGHDDANTVPYGNPHIKYGMNYYFNDTYTNPTTGETNGIIGIPYYDGAIGHAADIVANVSDGSAFYNYTAHGSQTSFQSPLFSISNINTLQNQGKYGLVIGNCCLTGSFAEPECFGEAWLNAPDRGAIGYIGASESTYWGEDLTMGVGKNIKNQPNAPFSPDEPGMYDALMLSQEPTQAGVLQAGLLAVDRSYTAHKLYYWSMYHLFGDPSLMVYMGEPDNMTVNLPTAVEAGETVNITISTDTPNAFVSLTKGLDFHYAGQADESGNFDCTAFLEYSGEITVTVTAHNKIPFIGTIAVNGDVASPFTLDQDAVNVNYSSSAGDDEISINLTNSSTTAYDFRSKLMTGFTAGSLINDFDLMEASGYKYQYGSAFDGTHIWVTSGGKTSTSDKDMLLKYDLEGNLVAEYTQTGVDSLDKYGLKAITFDGENIYGGAKSGFYKINPANGVITKMFSPLPEGLLSLTNLTYIPEEGFVTYLASGQFIVFNAEGNVTATYENPNMTGTAYGISYDSFNNSFWMFMKEGSPKTVVKQYSLDSQTMTGVEYVVPVLENLATTQTPSYSLFTSTSIVEGKVTASGIIRKGTTAYKFFTIDLCETWIKMKDEDNHTLNAGASFEFELTLNPKGFAGETKNAMLKIYDGFSDIEIPITMSVEPDGIESDEDNFSAKSFELYQNYPNPFNPSTTIRFSNKAIADVKLTVFNAKGELVATLADGKMKAGVHNVKFNAQNLNSGIYFYNLAIGGKQAVKKMILIK